ncbi:putative eka-like protein [Erysiphe necator]|uniref:Putative eka-like protein n=1 Tax=Uncinula necator TaxID=52586 RepID=A0A0B1NZZ3_UNCNE|nr:putative eka-like protein [Erysiphe necator]
MSGASLEPGPYWISVLVPTVPKTIITVDGQVEISKLMLMNEIERVSSKRPALVKLYGTANPEAPHRTWFALFSEAPRCGFRVFDESGITKIFKKKLPIEFFIRCNGHHNIRNCSRASSCGNCGSTMRAQDMCKALTKCRNCGGPHRSDCHRCLARPTRYSKPTKEQLDAYRRAGDREYQAAIRANAAEARAAIAENTEGANETSSRGQETIISVENPNETPVLTQAGEEMCL